MAATAVTPTGVRDGDPDALAGLCDVRGPAVLAYCEVVAGRGELGAAAAAQALGSFRAAVVQAGDLAALDPESLLISATRHAAARHVCSEVPEACARVPGLLAARADRSISLADHDWLREHIESCWTCRAPVARFQVADRAYGEPPDAPLPPAVKAAMVAAMIAVAPVRSASAGVPALPPRRYANGNSAHAKPDPSHEPYDLPAFDGDVAESVGQPTSFYELPPEDLGPAEAPGPRRERPSRRGSLLGKLGGAAAAAAAGARGTLGSATPAPGAEPRSRGAALPRPRRELSRRPAGRRRGRSALRTAVVLPVALVVVAIVAALAIAGVFGGGEPASAPQSFAPAAGDAQTSTRAPKVVVVSGTAEASAAAVEKAKARARAIKKKAAAAEDDGPPTPKTPAATPPPAAVAGTAPPPAPPPAPARNTNSPKPKIDAGNGATGAEQLPPAKDTSTVPDLAPPVEAAPPPPG